MRTAGLSVLAALIASSAWGQDKPVPAPTRPDFGVNVRDFGADNTGTIDSSGAINAAIVQFKSQLAALGTGATFTLKLPPGKYLVNSPINLEGINTRGASVEAAGATLFGQTSGQPVVSMYGSRWLNIWGLHVFGASTLSPSIGIQYGRYAAAGCAEGRWNNVVIEGTFSFAGAYIFGCESQGYNSLMIRNTSSAASTFALVLDGINHWGVVPISGPVAAVDTPVGMHEVWMSNVNLASFGTDAGSAPLWMSHVEGLRIEGYEAGSSQQNNIVWAGTTTGSNLDSIDDIQFDVHGESQNGSLHYDFFVTGTNTTPNFRHWSYRTAFENASVSVYKLDAGITAVTMFGSTPIDTPALGSGGMVVFDTPSAWTASGYYSLPSGSLAWNLGTNFVGHGVTGAAVSFSGDGSALTGIVPSLPSNIAASTISNVGGVIAVTLSGTAPSYNIDQWCFHTGSPCNPLLAHLFPAVTIAAPPAGGAQATAVVTAMTNTGNGTLDAFASGGFIVPSNGGTGYGSGNTLTMVGGTCNPVPKWTVQSQTGGVVGLLTLSQAGVCPVLPPEPLAVTGGTGNGLTLSGLTWKIAGVTVTASGAGYVGSPSASVQQTSINATASQTATVTTNASVQISAGLGLLVADSNGTALGIVGPTGSPVIQNGAAVDASGIRQTLTATFTVPANTSLVRFVQSGTLAASTVTLPTVHLDGQPIQFVNYAGTVTALTFSPSVTGWTNATQLSPNTGLRIRWDSTSAAWIREQ